MRIRVLIFPLIQILVYAMSRKFHELQAKSYGDSAKDYFLRFHNVSKRHVCEYKREKLFLLLLLLLLSLLL